MLPKGNARPSTRFSFQSTLFICFCFGSWSSLKRADADERADADVPLCRLHQRRARFSMLILYLDAMVGAVWAT